MGRVAGGLAVLTLDLHRNLNLPASFRRVIIPKEIKNKIMITIKTETNLPATSARTESAEIAEIALPDPSVSAIPTP